MSSRRFKHFCQTRLRATRRLGIEPLEDRRVYTFSEFLDPNPRTGNGFGSHVLPLPTGKVVITSPGDDFNGANTGAIYFFDGATGELLSTLRGSTPGDAVGSGGVVRVGTENIVVFSPNWTGAATKVGAVTWIDGQTGCSGVINASNSLIGERTGDLSVTSANLTSLANGNYVLRTPDWDNGTVVNAGAATWVDGNAGIRGTLSATTSLVGTTAADAVGGIVTALASGNYVVTSSSWANAGQAGAGAVTWGDGTFGTRGEVSATNSLVGGTAGNAVGGAKKVVELENGNYVVSSPGWDNGVTANVGAATLGSGTAGVAGLVTAANSLVGSTAGDSVGDSITRLTDGAYVVLSKLWDNGGVTDAGAATYGNPSMGARGIIGAANSLIGAVASDFSGSSVQALTNGGYVVCTPLWNYGAAADAGAVTFGSPNTGVAGLISAATSLMGAMVNDQLGSGGVTALTNGNYVVRSPLWDSGSIANVGAATWGSGLTGVFGLVTAANSLIGGVAENQVSSGGVTALTNGNYVVASPKWDNGGMSDLGAATWGNGQTGAHGLVSTANSLVGILVSDQVGSNPTIALSNGNYLVHSPFWANADFQYLNFGAITWADGSTGLVGTVTPANSLVGIRTASQVFGLSNGNFVVTSQTWYYNDTASFAGAATWGNGWGGTSGPISASRSLLGTQAYDYFGNSGVTELANGNFLVPGYRWHNDRGAIGLGAADGSVGMRGEVSAVNSIIDLNSGGQFQPTILPLKSGAFIVVHRGGSYDGLNEVGSAFWSSGTFPTIGSAAAFNIIYGNSPNLHALTYGADDVNGTFYVVFPDDGGGRVRVGSQTTGFSWTPPTLTAFQDQTTPVNVALANLSFTINDAEQPIGLLSVTATSDNPALFPAGGISLSGSGANRTLSLTPATNQFGLANITLTVSDGEHQTKRSFAVNVTLATPHVAQLEPFNSGVRFRLSEQATASDLNLYDYRNSAGQSVLGAADVQLVGASNGNILGSLTMSADGKEFVFVSSAGELPPDNYKLTLRSAAGGFHTPAGILLDGDTDGFAGGDFVRTFTVSAPQAASVRVSLPNFARGPGQRVDMPATGSGLPLQVYNGASVTALKLEVVFDPALLDITAIRLPPTAPSGSTAELTILGPGRVRVELSFASPLSEGLQTVGYLSAAVPSSAVNRYGERSLIQLQSAQAFAAGNLPRPVIGISAVHVNAYLGDVGRNSRYDSFDVQQVSRLALDLDSGFQLHPLLYPALIADFNGNGRIDSFDVQRTSRLALDLPIDEAPALPNGSLATLQPPPKKADIDGNGYVDVQDVLWVLVAFELASQGHSMKSWNSVNADVNGDGLIDPADVLTAIVEAAATKAEGEFATAVDLIAYDLAASRKKKMAADAGL